MNCRIIVERHGNVSNCNTNKDFSLKEYRFDDYRVAVAIENLLENINNVKVEARYYDTKKESTNND